jgi:hypothetical protein
LLQLLADENFNGEVIRALLRRSGNAQIIMVREFDLEGLPDPELLEWAAQRDLIVLTHDRRTMANFAYERIRAGVKMPGLILVNDRAAFRDVMDDLLLAVECSEPSEWNNYVLFIPM